MATRGNLKNAGAPPDAVVRELVGLFSARQYRHLEQRAGEVTRDYPDFPFAWKALSVAQLLTGGDAVHASRRAVELQPADAEAHNNLAKALLDSGQALASKDACLAALRLDPGHALSYNNLGNAWRQLGDPAQARAAYERALALLPGFADAAFNLGNLTVEVGDDAAAIAAYRRAVAAQPTHAAAQHALGRTLVRGGRYDEALAAYGAATTTAPARSDTLDDYAALLLHVGQPEAALAPADAALAIEPQRATAHNHRGLALLETGRLREARAAFEQAAALAPGLAAAHMNLGNVLRELLLPADAAAAYRRAIATAPDDPELNTNLLLAASYLDDTSALPLAHAIECQSRRATPLAAWANTPDPARPLRIGFVSGDLREHPVGRFLAGPLPRLAAHGLELFAYHNHRHEDGVTAQLRASVPNWRNVFGMADAALAAAILADRIDILVDLAGHTAGGRPTVFAGKPAPVQVAWFGYFATTGLAAIDYVLGDATVLPAAEAAQFVEQAWRLPDAYYCFTPPAIDMPVGERASGAPFTFGCFNRATKLNDDVFACWAAILERVPGAVLFLKARQYGNADVRQAVVARFAELGIAAGRLRIEGADSYENYLRAYREVDIALDPFPFTGGATSAEALWMGVPVLTLKGRTFIGHQGETILNAVGIDGWIAADVPDYIERAVRRAGDPAGLAELRRQLRPQLLASAFCDAPKFAANLAAAWRGMWAVWCERQPGSH